MSFETLSEKNPQTNLSIAIMALILSVRHCNCINVVCDMSMGHRNKCNGNSNVNDYIPTHFNKNILNFEFEFGPIFNPKPHLESWEPLLFNTMRKCPSRKLFAIENHGKFLSKNIPVLQYISPIHNCC